MTRPLKMPGARASKGVLRERLALALRRVAKLERLRFDVCRCCRVVMTDDVPPLCEDCCSSYEEYSDGSAYCLRHEPTGEDTNADET